MEIVYIFCEPKKIRVQLCGYNKSLFNFFIERGGKWDKALGEFTFAATTSIEQLFKAAPEVPFVMVNGQSPVPLKVFGFFDHPWEQTAHNNKPKTECPFTVADRLIPAPRPIPRPSAVVPVVSLPPLESDKFPKHWEIKLETEMRAVKYSSKTRHNYMYYNRFLCHNVQKLPEEIQSDDIKQFLAAVEKGRDYSAASLNLALSAIKFFYTRVLPKKDIIKEQHRPRKDRRLPVVLSKEEIKKMFMYENNIKHRLLLMMVYASGLRAEEVVSLKRKDIDDIRKTLYVRDGKGRKDRLTLMSKTVINALEEYYSKYEVTKWLFSGADPNTHIVTRTAQHIFEHALKRANINKAASLHSLRHSFATHLLESGTDIRYIQELLGHASILTTERYTHVARRKTLSIASPLDTIDSGD